MSYDKLCTVNEIKSRMSNIRIEKKKLIVSGTTTDYDNLTLYDDTKNFIALNIQEGMIARNNTVTDETRIVEVLETELVLQNHIFEATGESYSIYTSPQNISEDDVEEIIISNTNYIHNQLRNIIVSPETVINPADTRYADLKKICIDLVIYDITTTNNSNSDIIPPVIEQKYNNAVDRLDLYISGKLALYIPSQPATRKSNVYYSAATNYFQDFKDNIRDYEL